MNIVFTVSLFKVIYFDTIKLKLKLHITQSLILYFYYFLG